MDTSTANFPEEEAMLTEFKSQPCSNGQTGGKDVFLNRAMKMKIDIFRHRCIMAHGHSE